MSESSPKLLDLIPKEKEMILRKGGGNEERRYPSSSSSSSSDENKLELRLGLPGNENWGGAKHNLNNSRERDNSLLSLAYFKPNNGTTSSVGAVIGCVQEHSNLPWSSPSSSSHQKQQQQQQTHTVGVSANTTSGSPFVQNSHHQYNNKTCTQTTQQNNNKGGEGLSVVGKDASQPCCSRVVELQQQTSEKKKPFSPSSSAHTAVPNTSQKRAAPTPVVGWPPIRSFRKNLSNTSSGKPVPEPQSTTPSKPATEKSANENARKGLFVKINMDGVPIGRKVDLSAYNNYDSLSSAVDELFRGLLAAQRDSSAGAIDNEQEGQKPITGLLDGSGEYTLVYEDNEGDRMLVGDVPWHMFASTVKRLRVLKSSDLATLSRGGNREGKVMTEVPSK